MERSYIYEHYGTERLSALEAQRFAEMIAWGPAVFQVSRIMLVRGIFEMLGESREGLTARDVAERTGLSVYAVKCLLEASLCIGTILMGSKKAEGQARQGEERYVLSKVGWFLLNSPSTRTNIDFNHDVNYEGWFLLEESLASGRPEGLRHFGPWTTIYEGLSSLPPQVQKSWFGFDHFYSDGAFPEALRIVFGGHHVRSLYDVGGNTGRWALQCVDYDKDVRVTVLDLPQQIAMMHQQVQGQPGGERISGFAIDLLDDKAAFPQQSDGPDAIWMSQFLDCFSTEQIVSILKRAGEAMTPATRLYVMEPLWDRQRFATASFCLTMTSLYFTALANGNSKMYRIDDLTACIHEAGLQVEHIYDEVGPVHSIIKVKK